MTSLRSDTSPTPDERPDSVTAAEPAVTERSGRQTVRFAGGPDPEPATEPVPATVAADPVPDVAWREESTRDRWLRLAERVVGDWAVTLRTGLVLLVVLLAVIVSVGVVFGPVSALAGAAILVGVYVAGR